MGENAPVENVEPSHTTPNTSSSESVSPSKLSEEVAERIKSSTTNVHDKLVNRFVERELVSRVDLLEKALEHHKAVKSALNKIKPDVVNYGADDAKTESFSKTLFEQKKKMEEGFKKVEAALTAALNGVDGSFDKLKEVIGKTQDLVKASGKTNTTEPVNKQEA